MVIDSVKIIGHLNYPFDTLLLSANLIFISCISVSQPQNCDEETWLDK